MAGKTPRGDVDGVAAKCKPNRPRVASEPDASGARDSPPLDRSDGIRRRIEIAASFHLDESDRTAPSRNDIDFAAGNRVSTRKNGIAFEPQKQRREQFGPEAEQVRPASALGTIDDSAGAHRVAPESASARE